MKFWNWKFFDGEAATSDNGEQTPAAQEQTGAPAAQQTVEQTNAAQPAPSADNGKQPQDGQTEDLSVFDEKSPLLFGGAKNEQETQPQDVQQPQQPKAQQTTEQPETAQPYRTLKYHGQEIPVATEDDLIRLASQGLDYTRKTQQIAPYRGLVERLAADPSLMARVMTLVQTGSLPQPPQPQTQAPSTQQTQEKEPEMRDDETWDEYTQRRDAWKKQQSNSQEQQLQQQNEDAAFQQKVNDVLEARRRQEGSMRIAQLTMQDPQYPEVLAAIGDIPPAMQQAMNNDPITYQMVYDQIRQNITGTPYFRLLHSQQQAQPQAQTTNQTTQQQSAQPQSVQLKTNSKPAPYIEGARGQKAPEGIKKSGVSGLPDDVWGMDDKAFSALIDRTLTNV